ncbi:MAG: thiamine-phosphate kinase [Pirellulaceae bacterium]|nr:thiamine-phosphate kinase [Pirellulaceae bacterium]
MEHSFIAWAKQRASRLPQVELGIGDDAAMVASERSMVVTTDSLCDGTHFVLDECGPRAVGRKLAGVNLSDLAAMAAIPKAMFLSLCLPNATCSGATTTGAQNPGSMAVEIFEGVYEYAERYQVAIAGGDTNVWPGPLVVHMTAIGEAPAKGAWLRSGAKPNDAIVVSGSLGGSLLGKHLNVEPRIELAQHLMERFEIHAATDISDGLGIDLLSIFSASGCGAELQLDRIPISADAHRMAVSSGKKALEHAIGDGEDFELLLAVPPGELSRLPAEIDGVPLTVIGKFTSRTGLWGREGSRVRQIPPKGYTH